MTPTLDHADLERIVRAVADRFSGGWLLIGGGLVSLWLDSRRTTQDVDIIGLEGLPEERYQLMTLAQELNLPIEAVNSAADFFVRQISGWEEEIVPFLQGAKGVIYRPTPTLFLLLKAKRLSVQDLEDCKAAIREAKSRQAEIDAPRVIDLLRALPLAPETELQQRREELVALLADDRPHLR